MKVGTLYRPTKSKLDTKLCYNLKIMSKGATIISFKDVDYQYEENKPVLMETSFSIRKGAKLTLMGKNGAGKSTLFGLITKKLFPAYRRVHRVQSYVPAPIVDFVA
ncbi:MAG TPA: ATP-binding cassette domain-containing protein [Calditrichaeota bacterium]|nr:ATP-binding cassette domain-containing protein [Calditrichota bacterium]